ncbi:MAG: transcription-repair coupling factor, partial [Dehalococcoidia bacterium]
MELSGLLPQIQGAPTLATTREAVASGRRLTLGLPDAAKAAALAALLADQVAPALVVVPRADRAQALAEELTAWLPARPGEQPERILLFPERDPLPYERLAPDPEAVRDRLRTLSLLATGQGALIVVASAKALAQRTLSPEEVRGSTWAIAVGQPLEPEGFLARLSALGYAVVPLVERPGQVSRRGGIIDVFPPQAELPARIELLGRQVESLRPFDPASQRSLRSADSVPLRPAREAVLPSRDPDWSGLVHALDPAACSPEARQRLEDDLAQLVAGQGFPGDYFYVPFLAQATLIQHLPRHVGALLVCDESADLAAALEELTEQAEASRKELEERGDIPAGLPLPYASWREVAEAIESHERRLYLSRWASGEETDTLRLPFGPAQAYGGQLRRLATEVQPALRDGRRIVIISQQAQRLAELFSEQDLPAEARSDVPAPPAGGRGPIPVCVYLVLGSLPGGWHLREDGTDLALITDTEIFGFSKQRRAQPPRQATVSREAFLSQLSPADYVVHVEHGIGKFAGLVRLDIDGRQREYLEVHYAEGDRLFVPTDQLDRVSRYVGPGDYQPRLTRLGSGDWQRAKSRVRRAVQDLARELLALYAAREVISGHAYPPDTPWQLELEASFPYLETPDQLAAIAEVKRDMERARPMDRLVCGDVGYGKTEVAVRAAFKATLDGKQVALLVPTTVLAQQHYQTFRQRLAAFPLRMEMLSRFRSEAEQRQIIEGLATGAVDIVIGTHRLLQKDVRFKNLGLAIIDEEQRFGVAHKEHLKSMRKEVDVLTLSATPIPRTLYMALGGIRDMSAMETPPEERLPIKTYVSEFDERLLREAILRELERGGQVYFVHNRVHSIENVARKLEAIVPEAIISVAHGQMPEHQLEQAMAEFVAGRIDVLVCTTIIESGLDIPNV